MQSVFQVNILYVLREKKGRTASHPFKREGGACTIEMDQHHGKSP